MTPKESQLKRMEMQRKFKAKHPDALIVMRCGDFYELLDKDAEVAASVLGITLTKHNDTGDKIAAFPYHALDVYLPKLIRAGHRVAICEELTIADVLGLPITDAEHVLQEINTMRAVKRHLQQDFEMRKLKRKRVKKS